MTQTLELSRRSVIGLLRQPQAWFPGIFFPLLLAAVYTAQFDEATALAGFPEVDSFLDFLLPATLLQGAAFGAINSGSDLALDIENGFFERLLASPVARLAILVGRLAGAAGFAAVQAVVFMVVFLAFGATVAGGIGAAVVVVAVGVLLALGIGGLGAAIALRTGSQEAVQSAFPLIFILLFLSSAFFPTQLMTGWFRRIAENNPLTWVVDATRSLVVVGFDWGEAAKALGSVAGFAAVTVAIAVTQLNWRLERG